MAIKVSGTTVIDDSRNITDIENFGDSNTVYYGDGSNLSGVEFGVSNFVASGAISNGDTVIVNTDGTASSVSGTQGATAGSYIETYNSTSSKPAVVYDTANNKVVIFYADGDNSSYGTARVGTVDATNDTITFGPAVVFHSDSIKDIHAIFDPDTSKIIIIYVGQASSNRYGTSIVGTVSGNSISFGSESTFFGGRCDSLALTYDEGADKPVVAYREFNNSFRGSVRKGYYNNSTSLAWGSSTTFQNTDTGSDSISLTYDPDQGLIVVCWGDHSSTASPPVILGKAATGNATGTGITLNSAVTFDSGVQSGYTGGAQYSTMVYDTTNDKLVIFWGTYGLDGYAIVGTVGSSSITFGTATEFEDDAARLTSSVYDSNSGKIVVFYTRQKFSPNPVGYFGTVLSATVSGNSISFSPKYEYDSGDTNDGYRAIAFDPNTNRCIGIYNSNSGSVTGKTIIINSDGINGNLTTENYIGIAAEAIADGATGKINIVSGVNASQTGLTAAQKYYVNGLGGLSLTPSIPSVVAGTSISSTEIVVK